MVIETKVLDAVVVVGNVIGVPILMVGINFTSALFTSKSSSVSAFKFASLSVKVTVILSPEFHSSPTLAPSISMVAKKCPTRPETKPGESYSISNVCPLTAVDAILRFALLSPEP